MNLLDKYILKEFIPHFLIAFFGFIIFMLSNILFLLTDTIVNKNIPFKIVAKLLILKMPSIIVLTLPVAMLFGTVLCITTMTANNEITALRSMGVSFIRIMTPFLLTAIALSLFTYITNENIAPWATGKAEIIAANMILKQNVPPIEENVFYQGPNNKTFYVEKIDRKNRLLREIMVFDGSDINFPRIIKAKEGTWQDRAWCLKDGCIYKFDESGSVEWAGNFEEFKIIVDMEPPDLMGEFKSPDGLNAEELKKQIEDLEDKNIDTKKEEVALHTKYSLPLASLVIVLIGGPLSVTAPRKGKLMGILYSFGIVFLYHNLMSVGKILAETGVITPFWGAWSSVIIAGTAGILLLFNLEYCNFICIPSLKEFKLFKQN